MDTRYFRDSAGWHAKSTLDIAEQPRVLTLRTERRTNGALTTTATIATRGANGLLSHVLCFGGARTGDYSKTLAHSQPARVTESVVRRQHELVLGRIDEILADVASFYQAQERTEVVSERGADHASCA